MPWQGSILVKFLWCPGGFLYLNGKNFIEIWEIFGYDCVEYVMYPFGSMPMILRFGLLVALLSSYIFFSQVLSCLTKISFFSSSLAFCIPLVLVCWSGLPSTVYLD
jgi:hypothetical protein